jgi:glycosyltransferase involved in cell wall biosynthesis
MNNPKFTIVLPTLNRDSLTTAIDSVVNQVYPHWQLIVVGDGWEPIVDNTTQLSIRGLMLEDGPHNDWGTVARNVAIETIVDADSWIAYIDDDDEWSPMHLEILTNLIRNNPEASMAKTAGQPFFWKHKSPRHKELIKKFGEPNIVDILTPGMSHTLELFKRTSGWQVSTSHDKLLWDEMMSKGGIPVISDQVTFIFER